MGLFEDESVNDTVKGDEPEVISAVKLAIGAVAAAVVTSKNATLSEINNNWFLIKIFTVFIQYKKYIINIVNCITILEKKM